VGDVITGGGAAGVLHAGTALRDGAVVSAGGRVLSVVGTGEDLAAARSQAYRTLSAIRLAGGHFRTDIALAAAEGRIAPP
jgi:phosphoribosylamine--glycine ligase